MLAGCASWQAPRIDPTGERLLIWPNERPQPVMVGPPVAAPIVAAPPGLIAPPPPAAVVPPFGNVQAPPVFSETTITPPSPAPMNSGVVIPPAPVAAPVITTPLPQGFTPPPTALPTTSMMLINPVVPIGAPTVATTLGGAAPFGAEYLRIMPAGAFAPVGSEVVLKAGICRPDGYSAVNQRIEWSLDGSSAGQFGDLGQREGWQWFRSWSFPRLIDNCHATGNTASFATRLSRGTPDPGDDVQIERGDAWISVTSATEGTSQVTACAPGIGNWNRATATIYWIDAQWVFPSSAVVEAGRPHVLTTTVTRRTNGTPLAGWLVRYDVAGGASLGYEGGNFVEVPTDANGRASVEVSPNDVGGGTTIVGVTIARLPLQGAVSSPRLDVGRGSATINWGTGSISASPAVVDPYTPSPMTPAPPAAGPPSSPYTPGQVTPPPPLTTPQTDASTRPSLPSGPPPADRYTPPADEPTAGRPQLEVTMRRTGPEQVGVGEFASFEVVVTNRGTATARGIMLVDRFDRGLRHPNAKANEYEIKYPGIRDLPPGESSTIPLTFQVVDGGTQCHEVTVTAEGSDPVSRRECITARQSALEVNATGPRSRVAGETAEFSALVRNVGDVAATNIEIVARCDAALEPMEAEPGHQRLPDGSIVLKIDRLEPSEKRTFRMAARCASPSNRACTRFIVNADGGVTAAAEACVEILPPLSSGPAGAAAQALRLTVTENKNPTRVNEQQVINIVVQNPGEATQRQVLVRALLPMEFTANAQQIQPQAGLTVVGQEVQFAVEELAAQQQQRFVIPVNANRAGSVTIPAVVTAEGMTTPITVNSNLIEILPASL